MSIGIEMELEHAQKDTASESKSIQPSVEIRVKNRRKRYLDMHQEYFSADLELAGPLTLSCYFLLRRLIAIAILVDLQGES